MAPADGFAEQVFPASLPSLTRFLKLMATEVQNGTAQAATPYQTRIDLDGEKRHELAALLNQVLADTMDLYAQTKQAHWNVKGENFYQLHLLYDRISEDLPGLADQLAERVAILGGYARGTVRMAAADSQIAPFPGADEDADDAEVYGAPSFLTAMAERWATYAASIRDASRRSDELDEPATADLFDEMTHVADRGLWFIEAQLQRYDGGLPADGGADAQH